MGLRVYTEAWNNADQRFPCAIQIVDLYHARKHLWELARKLNPADEPAQKRWLTRKLADAEKNSELAKPSA